MAALICDGLGKLCSGCGQLCLLPCRLCKPCCEVTAQLFRGPFCIYGVVAFALNIPQIIVGAMGVSKGYFECLASTWLLVNTCFCILHILAPWYLNVRILNQDDPTLHGKNSFQRVTHLLCYDPLIALYILVLLASLVWLFMGVSWRINGTLFDGNDNDDQECHGDFSEYVGTSLGCGFAFLSLGCFAFCCSLCCAGVDGKMHRDDTVYHVNESAANETAPTSYQNQSVAQAVKVQSDVENIPVATAVAVPVNPEASAPPQPSKDGDTISKVGKKIGKTMDSGLTAAKKLFGKKSST